MHLLQIRDRRDLHLDDLDRRDVELHQLMDLNCDMDLMQMAHLLHLDVVQNLDELVRRHRQDAEHLDVQQILDVVHLDVVHLDAQHPLDAEVGAELRHLLRMDYFLDAVDVELPRRLRKDCYLDVVQQVRPERELQVLMRQAHPELLHAQQLPMQRQLVQLHVKPLARQDRRRALLRVQQQVLD
jgi:hypothetical protein